MLAACIAPSGPTVQEQATPGEAYEVGACLIRLSVLAEHG